MWTVENRGSYDRGGLRYPSDVTDDEWAHIAPLIPPAKRGGRKRNVDVRDVVNGLMYILSTGCQWRAIPKDLPPRSTLFGYFELWDYGRGTRRQTGPCDPDAADRVRFAGRRGMRPATGRPRLARGDAARSAQQVGTNRSLSAVPRCRARDREMAWIALLGARNQRTVAD